MPVWRTALPWISRMVMGASILHASLIRQLAFRFWERETHQPPACIGIHFQTSTRAKRPIFISEHSLSFDMLWSSFATRLEETRPLQPVWRKHRPRSQLHPPRRQSRAWGKWFERLKYFYCLQMIRWLIFPVNVVLRPQKNTNKVCPTKWISNSEKCHWLMDYE